MADVLEDSRDKVQENLLANGGTVYSRTKSRCYFVIRILSGVSVKQDFLGGYIVTTVFLDQQITSFHIYFPLPTVDLVTYITRFQWDMAKYPIKQSLKNISEIISKVRLECVGQFDSPMALFFLAEVAAQVCL